MKRLPDPMQWMSQGMPLTLLIDLLNTDGPGSEVIHSSESADTGWIPQPVAAA